jgi:hypothetical protein
MRLCEWDGGSGQTAQSKLSIQSINQNKQNHNKEETDDNNITVQQKSE